MIDGCRKWSTRLYSWIPIASLSRRFTAQGRRIRPRPITKPFAISLGNVGFGLTTINRSGCRALIGNLGCDSIHVAQAGCPDRTKALVDALDVFADFDVPHNAACDRLCGSCLEHSWTSYSPRAWSVLTGPIRDNPHSLRGATGRRLSLRA
jgi:hypothetical protein